MRSGTARSAKGLLACVAAVLVSTIPGADASASHVQCGDVITADTTLDSDVVGCVNKGVVIGGDDVTLDLNGHTIASAPPGSGTGVDNSAGHDRIIVQNGSISGFPMGIALNDPYPAGRLTPVANDFTVRSLRISSDFLVDRFGSIGLQGFNLDRLTITDVDIGSTQWSTFLSASNSTITGLTTRSLSPLFPNGRGSGGWAITGLINSLVEDSRFQHGGFSVAGQDNVARRNSTRDGDGITVLGDGNLVEKNLIQNGGSLINSWGDNRFEKNEIVGSANFGIWVDNGETLVLKNRVEGSGGVGIKTERAGSTLADNTVKNSGAYGPAYAIDAAAGTIDGGGNKAWGEGLGAQCINVICK